MSKRSVKKAKIKKEIKEAEIQKQTAPKKELSRKQKIMRRIGLGVFFTIGTIIILAAIFVIYALTASLKIDNTKPVNNVREFIELYEQNEFERDLPDNLILTEKSLTIDKTNHTYKITVAMKCNAEYEKQLLLQLFYNSDYANSKKNIKNPFVKIDSDDGMVLSKDIERFTVTGTYSKDTDIEELTDSLKEIYMEVKLGHNIGRVILPLDVYVE